MSDCDNCRSMADMCKRMCCENTYCGACPDPDPMDPDHGQGDCPTGPACAAYCTRGVAMAHSGAGVPNAAALFKMLS